jgi:parallel beta-helix repeat protein
VSSGSGTRIEGNVLNGRRKTPGVFVLDSANTVVADNSLVNNASTGILVRGTSTGTQVLRNQSHQNTFSGVTIENGPTLTLVADNFVSGNGGNGLHINSPSTTVTRNTAVFNQALGIFAVAGVTDGGGNKASGNGNPAQCSPNIACT